MVFREAASKPAGKAKKSTAWHLMPHNKHPGKQGCNFQLCNHKIFSPRKHRTVTIHRSVFVHVQCISFQSLFVVSLSAVIHQLLSISLLVVFAFAFINFCLITSNSASVPFDYSVLNYALFDYFVLDYLLFNYSVSFSVLILELYSRYFDPT
jgi:hypothetical protein